MRIAVVDGQGGGMGKALVLELRKHLGMEHCILALGTNSLATSLMMRAGAQQGATGENAVIYNAPRVDIIAGPIGILVANSLLGELTPAMAQAIAESPAQKVVLPIDKCQVHVVGSTSLPLQQAVAQAAEYIASLV